MNGENTDSEILSLLSDPNTERSAFQLLYKTYSQRLYWHIRSVLHNHDDADDVLQDVLVKAWKGLKTFRGDSAIYSWLYRIATNQCITFLNKNKKKKAAIVSMHNDALGIEETKEAETEVDTIKVLRLLQEAIDLLPEKQKQVFCLRYYDELSYSAISEQLNTSVGALKASYHHAVLKIQKFISSND